jgi:CubicO group peptidase (beta-lactamase class C family)
MGIAEREQRLTELLGDLHQKYQIPGVAAAVFDGTNVFDAAAGVVNTRTNYPFTTDTVFLIGSITKVWTTTLVMQLVDDGVLDLDVPVSSYLPELDLNGLERQVTLRHLVSHTSGITGDHFLELGRGEEAIAKYVERAPSFGQLHPLGELFSYCNSGFVITGRLLEVVTGRSFNTLLRERLIEPLGLSHAVTSPEEAILHSAAAGHYRDPATGDIRVWPTWIYPLSLVPAGTSLACRARDLLAFGQLHLNEGRAADGTQLLSPSSVKAMQQPHAVIPYPDYGNLGLGWMLLNGYSTPCIGHGGGSPGGLDWLFVFPERNFALVWFANYDVTGAAGEFGRELQRAVLTEFADIDSPSTPVVDAPVPADLEKYAGVYEHADMRHEVTVDGNDLLLSVSGVSHIAPFEPYSYSGLRIRPVGGDYFGDVGADGSVGRPRYNFLDFSDGKAGYFHHGYRAFRRTS